MWTARHYYDKNNERQVEHVWKDKPMEMGTLTPRLPEDEQFAKMWWTYFRSEDGKGVQRYITVELPDGVTICFPAEKRPGLIHISDAALERKNKESWNERTVSLPLPTSWMKTGL
ncbi:MAG: hypothetical protein [Microviridae sp.]|nr:MAG: hypothetical protein [Microviridae sp.]